MEQSYASSKMSPASADMSVSSTTTVREQIGQTSSLSPQVSPQKQSPTKLPSSPTVRVSKSPLSQFTSQERKSPTEHAQSELQTGTSPGSSAARTDTQTDSADNSDMEVNQSENKEIFEDYEEINPPGEIEEMDVVTSSGEQGMQSIKQEVDDFSAPPEPVRQLQPPISSTGEFQVCLC